MSLPLGAQLFADPTPLELEYGDRLLKIEVAYETWGRLSSRKDNAILVCPAFSGHCHANSHDGDPSPGWWQGMIGPGKAIDTENFFVVCTSLLGGSRGTTGPSSANPETEKPYLETFPVITIRDIVSVQARLLDHLGIERLYGAVGGSMGGMQTMELALRYPDRVSRVFSASSTDRTRPYTAAIRHLGRQAIMLDREYSKGRYEGSGPTAGLGLAREMGTLFYRSREEFNQRFRWQPLQKPSLDGLTFDVQSYLNHQGNKILGTFDANSYLTLSLAMDLHDIWRGYPSREIALEPAGAEFMIVGVDEDRLIPIDEQEWLHHSLITAGKRSHWRQISSRVGHDTFLVDIDQMTELVRELLQ